MTYRLKSSPSVRAVAAQLNERGNQGPPRLRPDLPEKTPAPYFRKGRIKPRSRL